MGTIVTGKCKRPYPPRDLNLLHYHAHYSTTIQDSSITCLHHKALSRLLDGYFFSSARRFCIIVDDENNTNCDTSITQNVMQMQCKSGINVM
jgi:hypothetical protein